MNLQKNVSLSSSMADTLARQIEEGVFPAGTKLPSIREYAEASGCSKNTVISAFETLTANGLIEPRRGSGFYVARQVKAAAEPEDARVLERAMDTVWLMREQLQVKPAVLNLGEGFPPIDWLEGTRLDQYHQRVVRTGVASLFRYGSRYGYLPLRQSLQQKLSGYEIDAPPSQIVLTHGANQAMDLVLRYFVRPGDAVLVDDPGYYPLFGKLKLSAANIIGVPREVDGPNLAELERCMVEHRPKLFFTQSVGHNPTGTDTSAAKAYRTLQLAEHHDTVIVENDAFADLRPRSLTRIATLDQLRRTIYIGSFSKSVSAALRVGFLACNAALASDLADVKMLIHVSSSEYSERTLAAIVSDGHFMRHTNQLQEKLRRATAAGKNVLKKVGASIFKESDQSMYLWASLPGWPDSMKLAKAMLNHGVILAPGAVFSPTSDKVSPYCRFNVGYLSDERFLSALLLATR
ncbi:PLP-dependent aminotransferase family protein [Paraburkholderia phenoliruptrix]|uniref:aminotransferase-like domain-containing protein n=1 Tax=Paraburkholderia phenoliruptrix TaxID=252970 RepID=UPI001C6F03CB|nr:PLP-dependent aminotransferase family protein [Paraburkholderia phenoliruptrix]MBW9102669.1 PLP-dependent aminotransferase family protein [Paraburkholderia phenoliruptrix]MBW9128952.1 PLP-dependent aminotransferase family protein [Paraburkholderia ginsengiterrae]